MRARNIKPSITKNEDLADIPFEARLLFVYLPMMADAEGRLEDRPRRIHAELFPYDPEININQLLDFLVAAQFIIRYKLPEPLPNNNGTTSEFIWICNFTKHQHPHKQERDNGSVIPTYDPETHISTFNGTTSEPLPNNNGSTREDSPILSPDSCILSPDTPTPPAAVPEPIPETDTTLKDGKPVRHSSADFVNSKKIIDLFNDKIKPLGFNSAVQSKVLTCLLEFNPSQIFNAIEKQAALYLTDNTPERYRMGWRDFFEVGYIVVVLSGRLTSQSAGSPSNEKPMTEAQKIIQDRLKALKDKENKHE